MTTVKGASEGRDGQIDSGGGVGDNSTEMAVRDIMGQRAIKGKLQ